MAEERRMGLFGWMEQQLTFPVVGGLLVLVYSLGAISNRFEHMEWQVQNVVAELEAEDEIIATKEELATVEARLRKWIDRMEAAQEEIRQMERKLYIMEARYGLESGTP